MLKEERKTITQNFFVELFRATANLRSINKELVEQQGIRFTSWQIIALIWLNDPEKPVTIVNIANSLAITRQAVQKQIKLLISQDIVHPLVNHEDKRSPQYALTEKGIAITHQIQTNVYETWMENAFKNFATKEIQDASKLLNALTYL